MACDHLDKRTFDNAMEEIKSNYKALCKEYKNGLKAAMSEYYYAWQSKKGWTKTNNLYEAITAALNTAGTNINYYYDTMKAGGEKYAKNQDMHIWIGNLDAEKLEFEKQTFGDDQEIIIDDTRIKNAGASLAASLKKINGYIDEAQKKTATDKSFGYYSDGASNPRKSLNDALVALENSLQTATTKFTEKFDETLSQDKIDRDNAKQQSAVEASDIDSIFTD